MSTASLPSLRLHEFEGPLDLLLHLIQQHKIDIYDIPIAEVTREYLSYLDDLKTLDLDVASDFVAMAATLTQIKSRMLLPRYTDSNDDEDDPRQDLVLQVLAYRRAKYLAGILESRYMQYGATYFRRPMGAAALGIEVAEKNEIDERHCSLEALIKAAEQLEARNQARYQDLREKNEYILKRESFSLKTSLLNLWSFARKRIRFYFHDFARAERPKSEQISQFLALLELVKLNRLWARQLENFAPIELELNRDGADVELEDLEEFEHLY
ncbi:MAG: segregation/condensation protein A [Eubacteriales bacterium]|nr:segregation/condensation protein A [Eubacteriales bacterium]